MQDSGNGKQTRRELVKDWMTSAPISIPWNVSALEAYRRMVEHEIRRLPVMDGDDLVGIVTLGDVRAADLSGIAGLDQSEIRSVISDLGVDRLMSRPVITVTPETPVREATKLMLEHKIAGLPVVSDERMVGIITESDIFRMVVETWEGEADPAADLHT